MVKLKLYKKKSTLDKVVDFLFAGFFIILPIYGLISKQVMVKNILPWISIVFGLFILIKTIVKLNKEEERIEEVSHYEEVK